MAVAVERGRWRRLWRHLFVGHNAARRCFPPPVLERIQAAIRDCESYHAGEIRFVVEPALHPAAVWREVSPRARALDLFARLGVWDTEHNNGVLIYLLIADRAVEIVADRGVAGGKVPQAEWEQVCRLMEAHFREGRFEAGAIAGVQAVADVLARYPPGAPSVGNELPDAPLLLS